MKLWMVGDTLSFHHGIRIGIRIGPIVSESALPDTISGKKIIFKKVGQKSAIKNEYCHALEDICRYDLIYL